MLTSQFPHFTNQSKIPRLPPRAAQLYCSSLNGKDYAKSDVHS